jgi:hypothetical protein
MSVPDRDGLLTETERRLLDARRTLLLAVSATILVGLAVGTFLGFSLASEAQAVAERNAPPSIACLVEP